jgi:hypothetical protein
MAGGQYSNAVTNQATLDGICDNSREMLGIRFNHICAICCQSTMNACYL